MAAVRTRQLAHASAGAAACVQARRQVARDAGLGARGEAHQIEDVRHHAVSPMQARLRELRRLLDEVDRQKGLRGTRKQHTCRGVAVNEGERTRGVGERGVCFGGAPSRLDDRDMWRRKFTCPYHGGQHLEILVLAPVLRTVSRGRVRVSAHSQARGEYLPGTTAGRNDTRTCADRHTEADRAPGRRRGVFTIDFYAAPLNLRVLP